MGRPPEKTTPLESADPFVRFGEVLLDNPTAAVADLLTGRIALGAQQRAEPEDFLADLLAHPHWQGQGEVLTDRLDRALRQWLLAQIDWDLGEVARYGTRAYVSELSDALAVAARLPLRETARELIDNQVTWDNRLSGLRRPGDIDLWRRLDVILIQHQPDTRFAARWFDACERAAWGGPQWRDDLTTGLLGLRKLPHPPDSVPERSVAAALARFAVLADERGLALPQVELMFRRGASALLRLYPRRDRHWKDLWSQVIDDIGRVKAHRPVAERIRGHWLPTVAAGTSVPARGQKRSRDDRKARRPERFAEPPARHEVEALIRDMKRARVLSAALWNRIGAFMARHWAYVDVSGDSHFAVLSLHNLATRLLRLAPGRDVLTRIYVWTLRAIELESENAFAWGLWARVLGALGEPDSALAVRWESVRRFPKDPVLRNELAQLLLRRKQHAIAELLLRETKRDFLRDDFCRNMLADLLRESGRLDEAEQLLREAMRDFPRDNVSRNALADVLRETGRLDEAEQLLTETMRDFPRDEVCRNMLADLLRETGRRDEAEQLLTETMRDFPRDEVCRNRLALFLWQQRRIEEAQAVLAEAEAIAPGDPYVQAIGKMIRGETEPAEEYLAEHILPKPFYLAVRADHLDEIWEDSMQPEEPVDVAPPPPGQAPIDPGGESDHVEYDGTDEAGAASLSDTEVPAERPYQVDTLPNSFLALLRDQGPMIQAYFAGTSPAPGELSVKAGTSEIALVAAHRVGRLDGEGRALLEDWVGLRPQSFAARLLLAVNAAGTSLDQDALNTIGRDFPDHRRWVDPLRLAFQPPEERRAYLSGLESSRGPQDKRLWDGRIEAVFPGLRGDSERPGVNPEALRRLMEDIALAEAARAVPSVALA